MDEPPIKLVEARLLYGSTYRLKTKRFEIDFTCSDSNSGYICHTSKTIPKLDWWVYEVKMRYGSKKFHKETNRLAGGMKLHRVEEVANELASEFIKQYYKEFLL